MVQVTFELSDLLNLLKSRTTHYVVSKTIQYIIVEVPAPMTQKEVMHVPKTIPQERVQQCTGEQVADMSADLDTKVGSLKTDVKQIHEKLTTLAETQSKMEKISAEARACVAKANQYLEICKEYAVQKFQTSGESRDTLVDDVGREVKELSTTLTASLNRGTTTKFDASGESRDAQVEDLRREVKEVSAAVDKYHELFPDTLVQEQCSEAESTGADSLNGGLPANFDALVGKMTGKKWSNVDIFLREMISNARNAFEDLDPDKMDALPYFFIPILADLADSTLTITDSGTGMTKKDLKECLGALTKSGNQAFIEGLAASGDISMIGQFGINFCSVFLVSHKVCVVSKHDDDEQYFCESGDEGSFTIKKDTKMLYGDVKRGTKVICYLKEDQSKLLDEHCLNDLVKTHSERGGVPIEVYVEK